MAGDASAYAALGVQPGSDAATIEQAYKRLIKQFHPDREGGDAQRAAEINHAYRTLRRSRALKNPLELNVDLNAARRKRRGLVPFALLMIALIAVLLFVTGPGNRLLPAEARKLSSGHVPATAQRHEAMDDPLHWAAIDSAIAEAAQLARTGDEMALTNASQDCHGKLRARPTIEQLDRCIAFDDAVVLLQDRDPMRDRGPFSELTVTRRGWAAASQLGDDYLAIDTRLSRISLHVELALLPKQPVEALSNTTD